MMDPTLASSAVPDQVAMCIQIGLLCTQGDPKLRPTMSRVVLLLSKRPGTLEEPTRPRILRPRHTKSAFASDVGTSGVSYSSALTTNTVSATEINSRASSVSRGHDTRGKRPVEG